MSQDNGTLITLTIANNELALQVIGFKGHEALNEPYRFDIDLISPHPSMDFNALISRSAYLSFDAQDNGIHGLIADASQRYTGASVSHYRVSLVPRIHTLQQRCHRRIFQAVSAPQIIAQLLEEHGIHDDSYRFEPMVGLYPPRSTCVQYDESDLHLLQRLCEEEGIHYRFEHHCTHHVLIFGDDPGGFPELPTPICVHTDDGQATPPATISHMAERFSIQPNYSSHGTFPIDQPAVTAQENISLAPASDPAANQSCKAFGRVEHSSPKGDRSRQLSERTLERLRCQRRQVHGHSNHASLVSGQILQVLAHPDNLFNDQWLLTEIHHAGKQPQLLDGFDPLNIAAIFDHDPPPSGTGWQAPTHLPGCVPGADIAPFSYGYRNHFRAIPWAMPFRPQPKHTKPQMPGDQTAILMGIDDQPVQRDEQGRVQVRFDWQPDKNTDSRCWLPLASQGIPGTGVRHALTGGTQVVVRYVDNDPDRPLICGSSTEDPTTQDLTTKVLLPHIRIDDLTLDSVPEHIHLSEGQTLRANASRTLTLNTPGTRIELQPESIRVSGLQSLSNRPNHTYGRREDALIPDTALCHENRPPYGQPPSSSLDLRLTEEPGLLGPPLAHRVWYIVRMDAPSLKNLARLEPQHFLFEGKTDHDGFLGLNHEQLQQLATEYRKTPQRLCLVHPGHCLPLAQYFQQNWTPQQLLAFSRPNVPVEPAPPFSSPSAAADLSALFQWLSRP